MAERIPSNLEQTIRNRFSELFNENKIIEDVFKRVKIGTATYEDAQIFAQTIGDMLSGVFNEINFDGMVDVEDLAYNILGNALNQNYKLSALVSESIQTTLNEMAETGVAPIIPKVNANRIQGLQKLIMDAEDKTQILSLLGEPITNFTQSCVDDFVKQNAEFQGEIGLDPIIQRKVVGGCCKWCLNLAGTYDYGNEPKDIYRRHEFCRCTVQYFPNKKSKGRITALSKKERDIKGVLWNTGKETSYTRKAVLARRRREFGKDEARKILNEEWKDGLFGLAERHFT